MPENSQTFAYWLAPYSLTDQVDLALSLFPLGSVCPLTSPIRYKEISQFMLSLCPITLSEANEFVRVNHRHHGEVVGHKFSIGLATDEEICGVIICGRPVARGMDDGLTIEVNRCCTDGTKNACSKLYSAAWRAAKALGYKKMITYTLADESGSSLSAAGWKVIHTVPGRSWSSPSRPRVDKHPLQDKLCWEA